VQFPHHVDIHRPPGGLGMRLDTMYQFIFSTASSRSAVTARTMPMAQSFSGVCRYEFSHRIRK
jgi:hypothetical protein